MHAWNRVLVGDFLMRLKTLLLAATAFVSVPAIASAEPMDSWYLDLGVGANWLDVDGSVTTVTGGSSTDFEGDFETGWVVLGDIGYQWDNVRLALEIGYRDNDLDTVTSPIFPGTFPADGNATQFSQILNVIFDIPLSDSVELSIGGGLGGVAVDMQVTVDTGGSTVVLDGDDYGFAYQALAGLSVDVGTQTELFAEYRYMAAEVDLEGTFNDTGVPFEDLTAELDLENHSGLIGIRYFFEEAAAPVEAGPPPPPPPPQTAFTVYFDFNKSNLTAEAQAAVAEAVEAHKTTGQPVTVEIQGDGDANKDASLSDRRAAAVKAAMVDLGASPDAITIETRDGGDALVTLN